MRCARKTVQRHRHIAATQNGLTLVQKSLLLNPLNSRFPLRSVAYKELKALRSDLLDRICGTVLAGGYLLQNNLVRPLIIQRATGNIQLLIRRTILKVLSRNDLFQGLLAGWLARIIRCLNRETVMTIGKLRKIRDSGGEGIHLLVRADALIQNVQVRTRYRLVRVRLRRPHGKELSDTGQ